MSTLRDYSLPLLLAFGVHAAVALALSHGWKPPQVEPRIIKPDIVNAALLVMERPPAPSAQYARTASPGTRTGAEAGPARCRTPETED